MHYTQKDLSLAAPLSNLKIRRIAYFRHDKTAIMRQSAAELQVNIGEYVTVVVPLTARIFSIYWSAAEFQYWKEKFKLLNFNIENNSPKN